jgi:hypothetical protein
MGNNQRKMRLVGTLTAIFFLQASCTQLSTESAIQFAILTESAARTQTAAVLPAESSAPGPSPTPSLTALPIAELTATAKAFTTGPHPDGVYQVGVTIAAGLWRSIPQNQDRYCYWARRKYDGIQLGSHYAPGASEVLIRPTDYEVEFDGCGVWVYMGER